MAVPSAFISYSHDSQEHKKWVLDLATRLRNTGVDAILDQWELRPGDDLPHFMEKHLAGADRVLMICTDNYVAKANAGAGGVGYEKMIVTSDLLKNIDGNKVIPVVRQAGTHLVPTFLKSKLFIDFSRDDQFEFGFDELVRALLNAPLFVKPPVGNNPFTPVADTPLERSSDAVLDLMKLIVADFERGRDWSIYKAILRQTDTSRLMLDHTIKTAKIQGLITQDADGDLRIAEKGKHFAMQHKLYL